jgi:RNA 2',3'-cyclic 3'-phosphodiesterase
VEVKLAVHRVFFALWPDDAVRGAFVRATCHAVSASGGRPVPARNLHITLHFVGSVAQARIADLEAIAADVAGAPVVAEMMSAAPPQLVFDRIQYWRRAGVLVATGVPAASQRLVETLAGLLRTQTSLASLAPVLERSVGPGQVEAFRIHVTLARKVSTPVGAMDIDPVAWSFSEIALVQSDPQPQGSEYRVVQSFPLGGGASGSSGRA